MTRAERKVLLDRVVDENSKDGEPLRQAVKDRLARHAPPSPPSPLTPWAAPAQRAAPKQPQRPDGQPHCPRLLQGMHTGQARCARGALPRSDLILWSHVSVCERLP